MRFAWQIDLTINCYMEAVKPTKYLLTTGIIYLSKFIWLMATTRITATFWSYVFWAHQI